MTTSNLPPDPRSSDPGIPRGAAPHPVSYEGHYPAGYGVQDPDSFDLWRIIHVVRRKWLTLLAVTVLFAGAAHVYLKRAPRIYRAAALIELSIRRPRIVAQQSAVIEDPTQSYEETLNTKITKLRAVDRLENVLIAYRSLRPDDLRSDSDLTRELAFGADYALMKKTRLVRVTFQHTDRRFAADACQAHAQAAEMSAREENRSTSDAAVDWLQAQAEAQRRDVEAKDAAILAFRQANQLDALEGQRKSVDEGLVQINQTVVSTESRKEQERDLLDAINKAILSPELAGQLPASMPRAEEVDAAIGKWNTARTQRDAMLAMYTIEHPAVASRTRLVELEREQAVDALARAKATAGANVQLLTRQVEGLRRIMDDQQKLSGSLELKIVERQIRLEALSRARDASDNAYRGLLARIQEARLAADENTATVKMITPASVPGSPVSPRVIVIMAMAVLLGLAAGGLLAFVTDSLDDYVSGPADVEKATGLPVLAVLPHMNARKRIEVARATLKGDGIPLVEAFAGLRSVMDSASYKGQSQVILMISSLPAEGKTVAACNLASAFARSGQKTLLVDFDLRRPRLSGIFPPPDGVPFLAEALAGRTPAIPFDRLAYDGGMPNLSVMAGRPGATRAPVDLVAGTRTAELVMWARARYDRIVLDAPPVGLVSDGFVLAGLADLVLLVTRVDASRRDAVVHALRRLYDMGVTHAAAIVGDMNFAHRYDGRIPYHYYQKGYNQAVAEEVRGLHS